MLSNRSQFGVYRSLVLVVHIFGLAACGTQVVKVPVDTRCQKQESITLTAEEANATPRSVLDQINYSNCSLWLSCPAVYDAPPLCTKANP